jgi:hypothetical protein
MYSDPELLTEKIIHEDNQGVVSLYKKQSLITDTSFSIEYRVKMKNGDIKFVKDQYTCYINETHNSNMRDRILQQLQAYRNAG